MAVRGRSRRFLEILAWREQLAEVFSLLWWELAADHFSDVALDVGVQGRARALLGRGPQMLCEGACDALVLAEADLARVFHVAVVGLGEAFDLRLVLEPAEVAACGEGSLERAPRRAGLRLHAVGRDKLLSERRLVEQRVAHEVGRRELAVAPPVDEGTRCGGLLAVVLALLLGGRAQPLLNPRRASAVVACSRVRGGVRAYSGRESDRGRGFRAMTCGGGRRAASPCARRQLLFLRTVCLAGGSSEAGGVPLRGWRRVGRRGS